VKLHLVPRVRTRGAIAPIPPCGFTACNGKLYYYLVGLSGYKSNFTYNANGGVTKSSETAYHTLGLYVDINHKAR